MGRRLLEERLARRENRSGSLVERASLLSIGLSQLNLLNGSFVRDYLPALGCMKIDMNL